MIESLGDFFIKKIKIKQSISYCSFLPLWWPSMLHSYTLHLLIGAETIGAFSFPLLILSLSFQAITVPSANRLHYSSWFALTRLTLPLFFLGHSCWLGFNPGLSWPNFEDVEEGLKQAHYPYLQEYSQRVLYHFLIYIYIYIFVTKEGVKRFILFIGYIIFYFLTLNFLEVYYLSACKLQRINITM